MYLLAHLFHINVVLRLRLDETVIDEELANFIGSHAVQVLEIVLAQLPSPCKAAHILLLLFRLVVLFQVGYICAHLDKRCTELFHTLLFHFPFLHLCDPLLPIFLGFIHLLLVDVLLLVERVDENGEEQVQQDEVSDEDPRDVVDGGHSLEQHVVL